MLVSVLGICCYYRHSNRYTFNSVNTINNGHLFNFHYNVVVVVGGRCVPSWHESGRPI